MGKYDAFIEEVELALEMEGYACPFSWHIFKKLGGS